ncbi:DsbA family protein [Lentibacillus saliphilus]|uniref:DsbA family protein n=1 Tax=Lentibacillus saliphilus TaxID=2737028 RepID=UPI001C3053C7|nr:DsbA family protein [Lentibacillus saliphilus]
MSNNHQMICDMETGVCGVAEDEDLDVIDLSQKAKKVDLYYVTDPICSHCWALEPVFRQFKIQYGHYFNVQIVMGGLLEKWSDDPIDPSNGIQKPEDVAGHWREVGEHSRMPIDGTLWYNDPVQSSFPPSRVFKVIQNMTSDALADQYLRRSREQLFAFNKNIAEKSVMIDIVNEMGLDGKAVVTESEKRGQQLLDEDFQRAAKLGVRGFPTIIMVNEEQKGVKIVGARSLDNYVDGLKRILNEKILAPKSAPPLSSLLKQDQLLFSKEIEVMYDIEAPEVKTFIEHHLTAGTFQTQTLLGEVYVKTI